MFATQSEPRRRSPIRLMLVAGVALAALGLAQLGAGLAGDRNRSRQTDAAAAAGSAPTTLETLEAQVQERPGDWQAWAALGSEYVTEARVASDPANYPKAEAALSRSLAINGGIENWEAVAGQGALAAGRHDFATALRFAEQAQRVKPNSSFIAGIVVDSLTELGRYPEAAAAAQAMVDLKPNMPSYARVSYQRELRGDVAGAIDAMLLARQAAGSAADQAFAEFYLGELEWNHGALEAAEAHFRTVLRLDPAAASAIAGLGKVKAARGDLPGAIDHYRDAVAVFPDPELLKELGDLYAVTGQDSQAGQAYADSERQNERQAANEVDVNLERALASADRGVGLDRGLAAAEAEWALRHSVHVADALGWQLLVNGRPAEALAYADHALSIGTRNASFHFHRAEIHRALGNRTAALADYEQAIAINPHFSPLHEQRAKDALAELRGTS